MSRVAANAACRNSTKLSLNLLFGSLCINMKSFKSISSGTVKIFFMVLELSSSVLITASRTALERTRIALETVSDDSWYSDINQCV